MSASERILALERRYISAEWLPFFGAIHLSEEEFLQTVEGWPLIFKPRAALEKDARYKQVIPYLIIRDAEGSVLCYERKGNEQRLHTLYSAGVGGHIDESRDKTAGFWQTVQHGLRREMQEETGLLLEETDFHFCGVINEERSKVGRVHWGLVFYAQISDKQKEKLQGSAELGRYKFCDRNDFLRNKPHEYWSALALELVTNKF